MESLSGPCDLRPHALPQRFKLGTRYAGIGRARVEFSYECAAGRCDMSGDLRSFLRLAQRPRRRSKLSYLQNRFSDVGHVLNVPCCPEATLVVDDVRKNLEVLRVCCHQGRGQPSTGEARRAAYYYTFRLVRTPLRHSDIMPQWQAPPRVSGISLDGCRRGRRPPRSQRSRQASHGVEPDPPIACHGRGRH